MITQSHLLISFYNSAFVKKMDYDMNVCLIVLKSLYGLRKYNKCLFFHCLCYSRLIFD